MKLILSRKGFDAGSGSCPSPIFPDGSMISLPIPFPNATHRMDLATKKNLHFLDRDVLGDLTQKKGAANRYDGQSCVHLDPYLTRYDSTPTGEGWKPAFGQDDRAQSHLRNQGVGVGDLFLFFGWFRRVEKGDDGWQYVLASPNVHVLFGWLQVQQVLDVEAMSARSAVPSWLSDHPHFLHAREMKSGNTVYIATDRLILEGHDFGAGGGTFDTFGAHRQLTAPSEHERGLSYWRLPRWFHPDDDIAQSATLSFHRRSPRSDPWTIDGFDAAHTGLQSVARGQEFVIDLQGQRAGEAVKWLESIFRSSSPPEQG